MVIKTILFDVDGVVVNTEETNSKSWQHLWDLKQKNFNEFYFSKLVGNSGKMITDMINEEFKTNYSYDHKNQKKRKSIVCDLLNSKECDVFEDSVTLMKFLQEKGYAYHFVTTGNRKETELKLNHSYLKEYTKNRVIISSSEISEKNRKPNPKHYILSMEQLGLNFKETIIIEDSLTGIISAIGSKGKVFGIDRLKNLEKNICEYTKRDKNTNFEKTFQIVNSLEEIPKYFR
jgi:beta-phosphoglucomutase-like phosphatase (HAD superfamily)